MNHKASKEVKQVKVKRLKQFFTIRKDSTQLNEKTVNSSIVEL
jgi:hypothetical protein